MVKIEGKSVFGGIAIGPVEILKKKDNQVLRRHVEDTEEEICRYEAAGDAAKKQLQNLYEKALTEVGEASAAIFRVHPV